MRSLSVAFVAAVVLPLTQAAADQPLLHSLGKRQGGDAFIPGSTIVSSCAADELQCGSDWCYTPSEGQICCSEGYPCPNGSFCLTQGYCCPDGDDPETCARANGVTLPAGFNTAPVTGSSAAPSTSSAPSTATPPPSSAPPSISESPVAPYPVPSSPPTITGTGTGAAVGTGSTVSTTSSMTMYTGGASGHVEVGRVLTVLLGLLSYLF